MDLSKITTDDLGRELLRRKKQTYSEDTPWNPSFQQLGGTRGRGRSSRSSELLYELEVGDVKRVFHLDTSCKKSKTGSYHCGLSSARDRLKKKGVEFSIYHEAEHIAIVARNK